MIWQYIDYYVKEQTSNNEKNVSNNCQNVQYDYKYQHQCQHQSPKLSKPNQTYAQRRFNSDYKSSIGTFDASLSSTIAISTCTTTKNGDYRGLFQIVMENILGNDSYAECEGESSSKRSKQHNVDGNITFRQRRLTLNTSDGEQQDEDTGKNITIESEQVGTYKDRNQQVKERMSKSSSSTTQAGKNNIRPRIMYSTEFGQSKRSSSTATTTKPISGNNKSTKNSLQLPFPPHQVGTYSCHGVEPHSYLVYTKSEKPIDSKAISFFDKIFGTKSTSDHIAPKYIQVSQKKINQDRGNIIYPFGTNGGESSSSANNNPNHGLSQPQSKTALFGVFDGHGECGEMIAEYTMNAISVKLASHPNYRQEDNLEDSDVEQAFKDVFREIDDETLMNEQLKSIHSGTTACVVLLQGNNVWVANVGDSRAVVARRNRSTASSSVNSGRKVLAIDWSKDQNVNDEVERLRVVQSGGFVTISREEGLPSRIWLDEECSEIGLAMSRSVGDHALKHVGVISEPAVKKFEVTDDDQVRKISLSGASKSLLSLIDSDF